MKCRLFHYQYKAVVFGIHPIHRQELKKFQSPIYDYDRAMKSCLEQSSSFTLMSVSGLS